MSGGRWLRDGYSDAIPSEVIRTTAPIEDDADAPTADHRRPPAPEPDETPTRVSASQDSEPSVFVQDVRPPLPVGLRENPRTNRPAVSVEAEFRRLEVPMDSDDERAWRRHVLDRLVSIDTAVSTSAKADAGVKDAMDSAGSWFARVFMVCGVVVGVGGMGALALTCAFLLATR